MTSRRPRFSRTRAFSPTTLNEVIFAANRVGCDHGGERLLSNEGVERQSAGHYHFEAKC